MSSSATARNVMTRSSAREEALIAALLAGRTVTAAAREVGISRKTAWRLRQSESFQARYKSAKDDLLSSAVARLHREAQGFIDTLTTISSDPKAQPSARVQAAREGITALYKGVELFDLTDRIAKLEEAATRGEEQPTDSRPSRQPPPADWVSPEQREAMEREAEK